MPMKNNTVIREHYPGVTNRMNDLTQAISDDVMIYLHIYLDTVFGIIISVTGVATNIINIIVFSKLGLRDSMSVGLFCLALTDFLVTIIQLAICTCYIVSLLYPDISAEATYFGYYTLGWPICVFYEISCWITAMVSVERCYCVVSPFTVKRVFTRYRCIVVTLVIYFVHISMHGPAYMNDSMESTETQSSFDNNMTTRQVWEVTAQPSNDHYVRLVDLVLDLTAGVSMWLCSQATIIICAVWMGYSLEASSKVRKSSKHDIRISNGIKKLAHSKDGSALSNRERRLVKVVLVLAITLTCCNVPKMITTSVYYSFPGTNNGKQENLSTVLWSLSFTCASLGCSSSFLVYLKLNVNYRRQLNSIFRCRADTRTTVKVHTIANSKFIAVSEVKCKADG